MLEAKPLTFLWKHWHCLKWVETSLAVCRNQVPLHAMLSTKGFLANGTEPTHFNSSGAECRLRKRKNVEHLYRISGHKIILFSSSTTSTTTATTTFLLFSFLHHHHHITIDFPPPPPLPAPPPPPSHFHCSLPPPAPLPYFYCFPSTTTTTSFLLSSLHEIL